VGITQTLGCDGVTDRKITTLRETAGFRLGTDEVGGGSCAATSSATKVTFDAIVVKVFF
jgi:hypothetical protein